MAESKIPINKPTLISTINDFTSSTSLEYTGVSVTIPGGTIFAVNFQILYMSTPPLEILLSRSSTSKDPYQAMAHYSDATYASYAGYAPVGTDLTIYVWARYGVGGANKIAMRGWYKYV